MSNPVYGLRLSLGGAPNTPHRVGELPGLFWPNLTVPVGGPGEISLADAKAYDKATDVPLELVAVDDPEAARAAVKAALTEARAGLRAARTHGVPALVSAERAALRKAK